MKTIFRGKSNVKLKYPGILLFSLVGAPILALQLFRGQPGQLAPLSINCVPDKCGITGGFVGNGEIGQVKYSVKRIQYDIINSAGSALASWTIDYSEAVASSIVGANLPIAYISPTGQTIQWGGQAYTTIFNAGFGVYHYNSGCKWIVDYEKDHVTFSAKSEASWLPVNCGVGVLRGGATPTFAILFGTNLSEVTCQASATFSSNEISGTVLGPGINSGP